MVFLLIAFVVLQSIRFGVAFKLSETKKDSECEVREFYNRSFAVKLCSPISSPQKEYVVSSSLSKEFLNKSENHAD